jgi:hypothetical protein
MSLWPEGVPLKIRIWLKSDVAIYSEPLVSDLTSKKLSIEKDALWGNYIEIDRDFHHDLMPDLHIVSAKDIRCVTMIAEIIPPHCFAAKHRYAQGRSVAFVETAFRTVSGNNKTVVQVVNIKSPTQKGIYHMYNLILEVADISTEHLAYIPAREKSRW